MSVIPVSALSSHDLRLLGNNINASSRRRKVVTVNPTTRAVNRSLARLGERVNRLHSRSLNTP